MSEDAPNKKTRRGLPIPLVIAAIAGLAYGGHRWWQSRQPYVWSGTIEARTIKVGSRTGGRIKEVLVPEGAIVDAGKPIMILEPGDLDAQLLGAQGALEQANANLEKLKKGARPEEIQAAKARAQTATAALEQTRTGARREQVSGAEARLRVAESSLARAQLDFSRMEQLFKSGAASKSERDNAEIALTTAKAQRDSARDSLDELKNGSRREEVAQAEARAVEAQASARLVVAGTRIEDLRAAEGQKMAAEAKVNQINVMIKELTIEAPRRSRVESLDLRPGDLLAPSATAATLLEPDQVYVRIYVPETQMGHIQQGMVVPVTVDSFPGQSWKGKVEYVASVGEYSPRNLQTADERADQVFAARITLLEGQDKLRAGMAAFIKVPK